MFKKLEEVEARFEELSQILSDPEVLADQSQFQKYAREHGELSPLVTAYRSYVEVSRELEDNKELLSDPDPEFHRQQRYQCPDCQYPAQRVRHR